MKNRIHCIDGMKGIAALMIACVYHLATVPLPFRDGYPFADSYIFGWIYRNGMLFVEFFFICSGFLAFLCYTDKIVSYTDLAVSSRGGEGVQGGVRGYSFVEFIKRRIFRIFPLMWITLVTSVVLSLIWYLLHDHRAWVSVPTDTIFTLGLSFLGLQNILANGQCWNYPAWCLTHFFTCWCIYYIIVYCSKGNKSFQVTSCMLMIILGISLQINDWGQIAFLNSSAARGYIAFFSGGVVYHIYKEIKESTWKRGCVVCCLLWLSLCVILRLAGIEFGPKSAAFSLFVFSPFILLVLCFEPLTWFFELKVLRFLGEISFSIYLCNYSIELFVTLLNETLGLGINLSNEVSWGVYVLVHIAIATFVHYIMEKRLQTE